MKYVGMDIHKPFTFAVIEDKEGNVISEEKFDNTKEKFQNFLRECNPEETLIVMESTYVWEYIYEILDSMDYKVKLANPLRTKAIASARIKTDKVDAKTLCDLLRANLISESYVPTRDIRDLRNITRQRKTIVQGRTQIKNKIHAVLTRTGLKLPYATLCKSSIQWIIEEIDKFTIKSLMISYINLLEQYDFELKKLEEKIDEMAIKNKQAKILMTIPGVGSIRALEIIAEIGDIKRFESSKKLCSYAGLVPGIKQSGNTLRFGRLIKQSSKNIKCTLIEVSWSLVRVKEENRFREFYLMLSKKKGKQKAICAVARKLCCVIHAMLRKNQEFMLL